MNLLQRIGDVEVDAAESRCLDAYSAVDQVEQIRQPLSRQAEVIDTHRR